MVKYWDIQLKHEFFLGLKANLEANKASIASIKLFKSLIKDQKERYTYQTSPAKEGEEEFTLTASLSKLLNDEGLTEILITNLTDYQSQVSAKSVSPYADRKKLFAVNAKYSHHDEINERLQFLQYLAQVHIDYQISTSELNALYQLLVTKSPVASDQEQFLLWCKQSCELSTNASQILDLNDVGSFFSEKMRNGQLDVSNLVPVGFDFLQQYFLSVNESAEKLIKSQAKKPEPKGQPYGGYTYMNGSYIPLKPVKAAKTEKQATFKVLKHPHELERLEIVWDMALQCMNPEVVPKAIEFLIKVYYQIDADLAD